MKLAAIIPHCIWSFGLVWGGFSYTSRETVVDMEPSTRLAMRHIACPCSIAGALALAAAWRLCWQGRKTPEGRARCH
jgi:TRAP-type C4-dicarboxylate transport system permease small subunit